MLSEITYTLLSDGSSDKALMPIIEWTIRQNYPKLLIQGAWANLSNLKYPPKSLTDRISKAINLYPCDLLFVHRDSEKESIEQREEEVIDACKNLPDQFNEHRTVAVIPMRMMEAWLLIDEKAVKIAAGNPNSKYMAEIPSLKNLESLSNPKSLLHEKLRQASGLRGRQLDRFNVNRAVHLIAENITDFSPLKALKSFQKFEEKITNVLPGDI